MSPKGSYGFRVDLALTFDDALARLKDALKNEGFGVLTSIDMQATLREKLGVPFSRYAILGVCNPPLAHQALSTDPDAGLVLPCTAIVREEGAHTVIVLADPLQVVDLLGNSQLQPMAQQAHDKLARVHHALQARP